jgi:hypothetical protein
MHGPKNRKARRGATLLVTLGVLSVISVMVVTYLLTMRHQRLAARNYMGKTVARQALNLALVRAMRFADSAMIASNFVETSSSPLASGTERLRRMAPVNTWFRRDYQPELPEKITEKVAFQAPDVLLVPVIEDNPSASFSTNALTIDLLTDEVRRLLPTAFTNRLSGDGRLRSGWINLAQDTRVSFAVLNCSGFVDANTFLTGPTNQRPTTACYGQADVSGWLSAKQSEESQHFELFPVMEPDNAPFFHLSYDADPDVYPLHYDCFEATPVLGQNAFGAYPTVNLNMAHAYEAMGALKQQATYWKFNLASLTNHLAHGTESTETQAPWFNHAQFRAEWLDPVVFLLNVMRNEEPATTLHRWPDSSAIAWNMANFMDADRIPQVSDFPAGDTEEPELATRSNYAVEDVPLINKITVFNIYDDDEVVTAPQEPEYYDLPSSGLSNHYAVAVELWYPFAPNPPLQGTACYVGIYTNASDVTTTTNRPWTSNELRDWFNWNDIDRSNSVMRTLFYAWARAYTNQVGPAIADHPLWQVITDQGDLWFTPAMTNHPSWPVADTNGVFSITNTPIWQAFYPDTYEFVTTNQTDAVSTNDTGVVTTNAIDVISTNVYTYVNATNSYVEWVSEPDLTTNRLVGTMGTFATPPYPVLLWSNLTTSVLITNVSDYFVDDTGSTVPFVDIGVTNWLTAFMVTINTLHIVTSNEVSSVVTTNQTSALDLAPWSTNGMDFVLITNLTFTTEVEPVPPLPMPEDLGLALEALFQMLPTSSLSSLYTFLLLTPDQFTDGMWRELLDYFNSNPSVLNRLMPSHQAPTLGNMTEEDRHILWPRESIDEAVTADPNQEEKLHPPTFQGYFWTVYPKQTVTFMEILETAPVDGQGGLDSDYQTVTNYHALGKTITGHSQPNIIWIRPVVTVNAASEGADAPAVPSEGDADPTLTDVIVDEALLSHKNDNDVPVWGWTSVTNLCIPDPRKNAYARDWRAFPAGKQWLDPEILNTTNLNTEVSELPFVHYDAAFSSIGDIGHIYAAYQRRYATDDEEGIPAGTEKTYDTITFSTRSGAALLDVFTLSLTNGPRHGLVQANTPYVPVLQTLLSDVKIGWTNTVNGAVIPDKLRSISENTPSLANWAEVYLDAHTNTPLNNMGWRSFADMLPDLSTNRLLLQGTVWADTPEIHPLHDYTEDVLRGLVDKVSFRQNIFVVVLAAQTLSPASTADAPIILADQRAAVTVLRDAYTGRWMIYNWVWLTE